MLYRQKERIYNEKAYHYAMLWCRYVQRVSGTEDPTGCEKQGIEVRVDARSESAVEQYAEDIDVLLIGPHCASSFKSLSEVCRENQISIAMIPSDIYSNLDGAGILALAFEIYRKEHTL